MLYGLQIVRSLCKCDMDQEGGVRGPAAVTCVCPQIASESNLHATPRGHFRCRFRFRLASPGDLSDHSTRWMYADLVYAMV